MPVTVQVFLAVIVLTIAAGCDQGGNYTVGDASDVSPDGDVPLDAADISGDYLPEFPDSIIPPECGNGTLETGEVCDDGNTENEPCDTTDAGACLGDCSLLMADCGNGLPDDGEQCDDGNDSSHDSCTTSCTLIGHGMGDPCTCEGFGCDDVDFAAGTIVGCEMVESYANGSRELACLRTASIAYHLYFAEGYCSLLAFRCDGSGCDTLGVREIGNVDTFTCPAGYASVTRVEVVFGNTITSKTCHPTCTSHSQCRWNAVEDPGSPFPGCSQYACTPRGDEGEFICLDVRNP